MPGFNWEPRVDAFYIDTIVHVNHLLSTVAITDKCKLSLIGFLKANSGGTSSLTAVGVRSSLDDILIGMIPTGKFEVF